MPDHTKNVEDAFLGTSKDAARRSAALSEAARVHKLNEPDRVDIAAAFARNQDAVDEMIAEYRSSSKACLALWANDIFQEIHVRKIVLADDRTSELEKRNAVVELGVLRRYKAILEWLGIG